MYKRYFDSSTCVIKEVSNFRILVRKFRQNERVGNETGNMAGPYQ